MKALLRNSLFLFCFLVALDCSYAQTITIPSGNSAGTGASNSLKRKPLGSYYGYERSAFLFSKSELALSPNSVLNSISFYCDSVSAVVGSNTPFRILIKEISDSIFNTGSTIANLWAGAYLVCDSTLSGTSLTQQNWFTINFSNPYTYGGNLNLMVLIETNTGGTGNETSLSKVFRYQNSGYKRFQFWQQDNFPPSGNGSIDSLRPNIEFNYTLGSNCSGMPFAGAIATSADSACANAVVNASMIGGSFGNGIHYQWISSYDSLNWFSNTSDTLNTYSLSLTQHTFVACIVSCGTNSDTSIVKKILLNKPEYCYCSLNLGGGCSGHSIDSVFITSTSFLAGVNGCSNLTYPHYSLNTPLANYTTTLNAGQAYIIGTKLSGDNVASLWIDYNQNGIFEASEWTQICTTSVSGGIVLSTITIPVTAYNGITGMRIRTRTVGNLNDSTSSCSYFTSGETEDFHITITGGQTISNNFLNGNAAFNLFPNPFENTFYIETSKDSEFLIALFDFKGNKLMQSVFCGHSFSYENDRIAPGIYLLQINNLKTDERCIKRIMKSEQ